MHYQSGLLPEAIRKRGWSLASQEVANVIGAQQKA